MAYLDPKILAKINRLDLRAKFVVEGFISGLHRSPYHGFSVEFAQHRGYVPGDDLKHLDWKVYAKNGRYCIKQYEAETNLVVNVLVDASASMAYASSRRRGAIDKLEYGKLIAASLSHLVLSQSDAVAVGVFDSDIRAYVERSTRKVHIHRICKTLEEIEPKADTAIGDILHRFAGRLKRRGIVVLVSDLFDSDVDQVLSGIQHLRHGGHEVVVLHLMDEDELTFPFEGMVQFRGMEAANQVLCNPRQVKKAYLDVLHAWLAKVKAGCQRANVDYALIDTSTPVDVSLSAYLARRDKLASIGPRTAART